MTMFTQASSCRRWIFRGVAAAALAVLAGVDGRSVAQAELYDGGGGYGYGDSQNLGSKQVTCYQEGARIFTLSLNNVQTSSSASVYVMLVGDTATGRVQVLGDGVSLCVVQ